MSSSFSPAVQDSDAREAELHNAASATGTKKDKRSHKGRRQMEDSFMIHLYKVKMCTRSTPHNWKLCPWAHPGEAAARRHPSCHQADLCHAVRMCPLQNKGCPHGESCAWSRNIFEAHLHPDRYRTVMCAMGESCGRNICFFAHNEQELRTPPKALTNGMVRMELPLNIDMAADAFHHLSMGPGSSSSDTTASNILGSSSNSAASNIINSSSSNLSHSSSSNAISTPRGVQPAAVYQPFSPASASTARSSVECAASPAAAAASAAAVAAMHGPAAGAMPTLNLAANSGIFAAAEPCNDLLSLQQQMTSRAAAAAATAAYPRTPTRESANAAAMQVYADAVSSAANAAAVAAAVGLSSPLATAAGSRRSSFMAAGSPLATSPGATQQLMMMAAAGHEMMHSPVGNGPLLQQQIFGYANPQQQHEVAALSQLYHQSQMQAAAATNAATVSSAAAAAAVQPGLDRLAAGIMQQRQLEASNAALATELLAVQSASAMQAAVQQQQQLANSMLLQELNLTSSAVDVAVQCLSPRERAALWEAEAAMAAAQQQHQLQGIWG